MDTDEHEEELRVGGRRVPERLRRPGMVVLVALAGLAAAFLTTRLGGGDAEPSTTPSRSDTTSVSAPASSTDVAVEPQPFPPTRVPICPGGRRCLTVRGVPAAVEAALRERYPGARVTSSTTLTAVGGGTAELLRRSIDVVAGARRLDIVITPFVLGPDDFDRQDAGAVSTVTVESTGSGKTVSILLTEPRVARPNDLTVLRLARDPRLAVLR